MFHRPFGSDSAWPMRETALERARLDSTSQPDPFPLLEDYTDSRQVKLAIDEPKRRLIRDARVLCQIRGITQGQMANELGISKRTLEEWMQFRRMPQAPSEALLRQWVNVYRSQTS
jgi:DNA-binding transcriptional regulator YiaG